MAGYNTPGEETPTAHSEAAALACETTWICLVPRIEKPVRAHGLRHTHAAELAREGVPVNVIQRQLGHANLAVTSRYLDHIAPEQVIRAMQARTWPKGNSGQAGGKRIKGRIGEPDSIEEEAV